MKTLYKVIVTLLTFIVLLLITCCKNNRLTETTLESSAESTLLQVKTKRIIYIPIIEIQPPVILPEDSFATIVYFGDTLCNMPVSNSAFNKETGNYDFSPMFKYVEKYFQNSTITIGNLESPMAGAERGYSGYPAFNAPEDLAVDLKELGVDIMSTANNHCLDKGFRVGILYFRLLRSC